MTHHYLPASAETCHWGFFDAARRPVLSIMPGDTVTIDTVSGAPEVVPGAGYHILPELADIHARCDKSPIGAHILTGPVAVAGAEPGDVLEVRIREVKLRQDWGFTLVRPLAGTLPDDFPEYRLFHSRLDAASMTGTMPWGDRLPLAPFFGVMGVAPPPAWGRITSIIPRRHGGNIDNKELVAGTTLYLPVLAAGANFSCGDGHGVQGDGEVCITAIETALQGTFEFHLHKGGATARPQAETDTHVITMAFDPDLDRCVEMALRDMIDLVVERRGLDRAEAYALLSLQADLRITQTVNQHKGVHCMLPKRLLRG